MPCTITIINIPLFFSALILGFYVHKKVIKNIDDIENMKRKNEKSEKRLEKLMKKNSKISVIKKVLINE